jgi:hypothetical protein
VILKNRKQAPKCVSTPWLQARLHIHSKFVASDFAYFISFTYACCKYSSIVSKPVTMQAKQHRYMLEDNIKMHLCGMRCLGCMMGFIWLRVETGG